ncbi:MAG: hypothetical protein ACPGRC_04895 [Salibacteraceae bacterium]
MSDNLKEFISKNEEQFDSAPSSGHFERFKKLQERNARPVEVPAKNKWVLSKIAAVFVLVIGVSWLFYNLGKMDSNGEILTSKTTAQTFNEELYDAEVFFSEKVSIKRQEVLAYSGTNSLETQKIMQELDKLELQYIDLKEELAINSNNPQIINAMVENYRMRFSLLDRLLKQLKKSNTIKQKHHDEVQA